MLTGSVTRHGAKNTGGREVGITHETLGCYLRGWERELGLERVQALTQAALPGLLLYVGLLFPLRKFIKLENVCLIECFAVYLMIVVV